MYQRRKSRGLGPSTIESARYHTQDCVEVSWKSNLFSSGLQRDSILSPIAMVQTPVRQFSRNRQNTIEKQPADRKLSTNAPQSSLNQANKCVQPLSPHQQRRDESLNQTQEYTSSPRLDSRSRKLHTSQNIRRLRQRISDQVGETYELQLKRQSDIEWSLQSKPRQCVIQSQDERMNRHKIVNKLITQTPLQQETKLDVEVATHVETKPVKRQQKHQCVNQKLVNDCDRVLKMAKFAESPEELLRYLQSQVAHSTYIKKTKPGRTYLVHNLPAMLQMHEERARQASSVLVRRKQMEPQEQMNKIMEAREGQERLLAQCASVRPKITADYVAQRSFPQDAAAQVMLQHKKPEDPAEKHQTDIVKRVEQHCTKLMDEEQVEDAAGSKVDLIISDHFRAESGIGFYAPGLPQNLSGKKFPKRLQQTRRKSTMGFRSPLFKSASPCLSTQLTQMLSPQLRITQMKLEKQTKFQDRFSRAVNKKLSRTQIFAEFLKAQNDYFNVGHIAKSLIQKLEYIHLCKTVSENMSSGQNYEGDPRLDFFLTCRQELAPTIDLLNKIGDQTLLLVEYRLSLGTCQGLMQACAIEPELFSQVMIDNCGLTDCEMAALFEGFTRLKRVKVLFLKRTVVGPNSLPFLLQLLGNRPPNSLVELRIDNCQITNEGISSILATILNDSNLEKISLNHTKLTQDHIVQLTKIIPKLRYLTAIDFSYNTFTFKQTIGLLKAISSCQRLKDINLSYNSLVENSYFGEAGNMWGDMDNGSLRQRKPPSMMYSKQELRAARMLGEKLEQRTAALNSEEKTVVECFQKIMSQNPRLCHLDISECGLSSEMLKEIGKSITNSTSLLALHLSGNPGLTSETIQSLILKLRATYEEYLPLHSFFQVPDLPDELESQRAVLQAQMIKKIKNHKLLYQPCESSSLNNHKGRHLIFTRKLGHELDIPGGQHWQAFQETHDQCYVCNRKMYTIFLWSPKLGKLSADQLGLTTDQQQKIVDYITQGRAKSIKRLSLRQIDNRLKIDRPKIKYDEETGNYRQIMSDDSDYSYSGSDDEESLRIYDNLSQSVSGASIANLHVHSTHLRRGKPQPILYGQFNDWQPQPMINLSNLIQHYDTAGVPNLIQELKCRKLCRQSVKEVKEMLQSERYHYERLYKQYQEKICSFQSWQYLLQRLSLYREPHLTETEFFDRIDAKQIYFIADFVGSGRQYYTIQLGKKFFFYNTIVNFRREELQYPQLSGKEIGKRCRNPNVFKLWQPDSPETLSTCVACDIEGWKLNKFIKDKAEQNAIRVILEENYSFLKDLWLSIAVHSNFPFITLLSFADLMSTVGIIKQESEDSHTCTQGIVDTQFIASRTDADQRGMKLHNQSMNDCNRFEFFEALVRVSACKFKNSGQVQSYAESFELIISRLKERYTPHPWHRFREDVLWTRDVNLVLDANKVAIMALYQKYARNKQNKMSRQEAMELMTEATTIKLRPEDAIYCYAFSLMTTPNLVRNSFLLIDHMSLVEFMEMIGRVAEIHMFELDEPLHMKINYVLDVWLQLVGSERVEPLQYDSDDYDINYDEQQQQLQRGFSLQRQP